MKKLLSVLLSIILLSLTFNNVKAEGEHIIVDDISKYFSSGADYRELNSELDEIKEKYDVDIYIVIEPSLNDPSAYARDFLNGFSGNGVILAVSSSDYSLQAKGSYADKILAAKESLWTSYNSARTYKQGIRDFYKGVEQIIAKEYSETNSSGKLRYVDDACGLMNREEQQKLNTKLEKLSNKYGIDFVIHTVNTLNGRQSEAYADDYYDYNNYRDDGLLLLLNMDDRYAYVTTKGEATDLLTDHGLDLLLDDLVDDLSKGDYYKAFSNFADQAEEFIVEGRKGNIIDDYGDKEKTFGLGNIGISAIIGAISSLITTGSLKGRMRNVSRQHYARNYIADHSFVLTGASDMLVDKHTSRSRIPRNNDEVFGSRSNDSGGKGSSVHVSSSGSVHGGKGRHF